MQAEVHTLGVPFFVSHKKSLQLATAANWFVIFIFSISILLILGWGQLEQLEAWLSSLLYAGYGVEGFWFVTSSESAHRPTHGETGSHRRTRDPWLLGPSIRTGKPTHSLTFTAKAACITLKLEKCYILIILPIMRRYLFRWIDYVFTLVRLSLLIWWYHTDW